jgi:hypothetical protein
VTARYRDRPGNLPVRYAAHYRRLIAVVRAAVARRGTDA